MHATTETQFDPEATRTRWPDWEEPILHILLSLDYDDTEIEAILGSLLSTGQARMAPHLNWQHVEFIDELVPAWVRTAAIEARGAGR